MRHFAGIAVIINRITDETTVLPFRHLLRKHGLGGQIVVIAKAHLSRKGMTMRQGTIVGCHLDPSAKLHLYEREAQVCQKHYNRAGKLDPEMQQTKKSSQCYFGR